MRNVKTPSNPPPKTKEQWVKEAIVHYTNDNYFEALLACDQALKLDQYFARAYHGKGLILTHLHQHADALAAFEKACQFAPHDAKTYADLGELLTLVGDEDKARKAYKKALLLDTKYKATYVAKMKPLTDPLVARAESAIAAKNYAEATILYREAAAINQYDSDIISARDALVKSHPYPFHGHPVYSADCDCIICNRIEY